MQKYIVYTVLILVGFTSCKKDYNCNCSVSSNLKGVRPSASTNNIGTLSKKEAIEICEEMSTTVRSGGVSTTIACKIE